MCKSLCVYMHAFGWSLEDMWGKLNVSAVCKVITNPPSHMAESERKCTCVCAYVVEQVCAGILAWFWKYRCGVNCAELLFSQIEQ